MHTAQLLHFMFIESKVVFLFHSFMRPTVYLSLFFIYINLLLGPRLDQVLNKTVSRDVDPRSLIKPVPGGVDPPSRSQSQDTLDSEKPPQWIEVTMVSTVTPHSLTH